MAVSITDTNEEGTVDVAVATGLGIHKSLGALRGAEFGDGGEPVGVAGAGCAGHRGGAGDAAVAGSGRANGREVFPARPENAGADDGNVEGIGSVVLGTDGDVA